VSKSLQGLVLLVALSAVSYDNELFAEGKAFAVRPKDAEPLLDVKAAREATEEEIAAYLADDQAGGGGDSKVATKPPAKTANAKK
jgi:hypothetical protein